MNNSTPEYTSVTASIVAGIKVRITAVDHELAKDQAVYALNWFDTRWLWLYNLYNILATRSVLKVAGVPFFKARVDRTLYGKAEDRRAVLLIVRYPGLVSFKNMMESRYFQIMSIVRGIAVKEFTFGLSTRCDVNDRNQFDVQTSIENKGVYVVHHFSQGELSNDEVISLAKDIANQSNVDVSFASKVSARLYSQKNDETPVPVKTIMTGCLVFQTDSQINIDKMLEKQTYQSLITKTGSSYIATLKRIAL